MYKINWFSSCLNSQACLVCLASQPTRSIVAAWPGWWSIKYHLWSWSIAKRSSTMLHTPGSMLRLRKPTRSRCMCGPHSSILDPKLSSLKVSFGLKESLSFWTPCFNILSLRYACSVFCVCSGLSLSRTCKGAKRELFDIEKVRGREDKIA